MVRPDDGPALDAIGLGEAMVELRSRGPLGRASRLSVASGGDVLNALVAMARLGSRVGFVSRVGDDPFGPSLRSSWSQHGIDLRHCPLVPGRNGVYLISLERSGEREFLYHRHGSAASTLTPEQIDTEYVGSARVVLLSGITQALSVSAQAATLEAARAARRAGTLIAFDPNHRPTLWRERVTHACAAQDDRDVAGEALELARRALLELLPHIDLLLPSFPADAPLWRPEPETPESLAAAVTAQGIASVGVKAGGLGSFVAQGDEARAVPTAPITRLRDSTGAGDAWNGALLHGLLQGSAMAEAAEFANRYGAWTLRYAGAVPSGQRGMPRWRE